MASTERNQLKDLSFTEKTSFNLKEWLPLKRMAGAYSHLVKKGSRISRKMDRKKYLKI